METLFSCRICGNAEGNRSHVAREMMNGTREEFPYVECGSCGCVQIAEVPADLSRHYCNSYYSLADWTPKLSRPVKNHLRRARARHVFGERNALGWLATRFAGPPEHARWFTLTGTRFESRILDVGCGSGWLLHTLHIEGFRHLTGVDPFVARTEDLGPGFRIIRGTLTDIQGRFDLAMMNHSLEHIPDQLGTLRDLRRLVAPDGAVLIRVPVAGTWAWRTYGVNWVQLDAPRHLFLHTERSLRRLAASVGFAVQAIEYDSWEFQITGSELYLKDIALEDPARHVPPRFRGPRMRQLRARAVQLNAAHDGDQACFYLRPV